MPPKELILGAIKIDGEWYDLISMKYDVDGKTILTTFRNGFVGHYEILAKKGDIIFPIEEFGKSFNK